MMKVSHQVQVAFYALAFEAYLAIYAKEHENVTFEASDEGGVWIPANLKEPKVALPFFNQLTFFTSGST